MMDASLSDHLRALELRRTQALVARDLALADQLHAPEYQLITPAGKCFDKAGYLAAIASGDLTYTRWDAGTMEVRLAVGMALVRYRASLAFPSGNVVNCWHTDSYELRDGHWLAVWSQATAINSSR